MPDFDADLSDPWVAKACAREAFHVDAVPCDKAGGRPLEQVRLVRESGLPAAHIPTTYGGGGASWR